MAPKDSDFRMSISSEFSGVWKSFKSRADEEGVDPAVLIENFVKEYMEDYVTDNEEETNFDEDFDESAMLAKLTGSSSIEEEEKPVPIPKKVKVKKAVKAKKKSFLAKKATVTRKREDPDTEESVTIQNTPKFRLLELVRKLDVEDGINPEKLVIEAEKEGIPRPRLQMNKMIRRGILYVHLDRVHVT